MDFQKEFQGRSSLSSEDDSCGRLESCHRRGVGWQDSLARYALALLPILEQPIGSLDPGVVACAFAAAQYLCQSEDAIPDHSLGTGYIDDAIVINRCLALFKRGDPKTFATVERLATSK